MMTCLFQLIRSRRLRRGARVLLPVLLCVPAWALALDSDRQQPVQLRADRIEIDQKKALSLYRGNVVLRQGTLRVTAARAEVQNRADIIETVTAEGKPATFRHRPEGQAEFVEGEANRVVYHALTQLVDLHGDVQVQRGRDLFRSAVLHYDIEKKIMTAEGAAGLRTYVALAPRTDKPLLPGDRP